MRRRTMSAAVAILLVATSAARTLATVSFTRQPTDLAAGAFPIGVTSADFNGDGKADLAVANNDSDDVSVLWGNGDGTFLDAGATFPVNSAAPAAIAVGDFNGDGKLDIITANEIGSVVGGTVSVLLGSGGTTFGDAKLSDTGSSPESVVVGDFDGDGKLDVATADNFDGSITVLHGVGDGTFTLLQTVTVGPEPLGLAMADFNGDGKIDLVVTSSSGGTTGTGSITVLKGLPNGMFEAQLEISSTTFNVPVAIATADLNGDSKADVIVANEEIDTVSVLLGKGDLTFQNASTGNVGAFPEGVVTGDFDGDGRTDIATSSNFDDKVSVLTQAVDGTLMDAVDFDVGPAPFGIVSADFNKDGKPDLATANMEDGTVSILLNTPVGGCAGDCDASGIVAVNELITMVNIALGTAPVSTCLAGDTDQSGTITINEIITAVNNALNGCLL